MPLHRNVKKSKRAVHRGATVPQRRRLLEERLPTMEERIGNIHRPGDWLTYDYLQQPTLEERLYALHSHDFLDGDPPSILNNNNEEDEGSEVGDRFAENDFANEW